MGRRLDSLLNKLIKLFVAAWLTGPCAYAAQPDTELFDRLLGNGELPGDAASLDRFSEYLFETGKYYWVDSRGKSLLHWSMNWQKEELFRKLLAEGALLHLDPRSPMSSLLHDAIEMREPEFVTAILERAESHDVVEELDIDEGLYAAAMTGQKEIAEYLVSKGASLADAGSRHPELLSAVIRAGFFDMAWYLIEQGVSPQVGPAYAGNALASAILARNIELTEFLLDKGFGVNDPVDYEGTTAFSLTLSMLSQGHDIYEIVDLLIDRGGDLCADDLRISMLVDGESRRMPLSTLLTTTENQRFKEYVSGYTCLN